MGAALLWRHHTVLWGWCAASKESGRSAAPPQGPDSDGAAVGLEQQGNPTGSGLQQGPSVSVALESDPSGLQSEDLGLPGEAQSLPWDEAIIPYDSISFLRDEQGRRIKLGQGASAEVFRAAAHGGSTSCACKVFPFPSGLSCSKEFLEEVYLLRRLSHPRICSFYGAAVTEESGYLLMELMHRPLGAYLQSVRPHGKGRLFAWRNRGRRAALQVAAGLAYLHGRNVVHLDITSRNVLLTREGDAKLGDVGHSRLVMGDHLANLRNRVGTWCYAAPEILLGQEATKASDIFSFGVLLWEICTGEAPRRGDMRPLRAPADCPEAVVALQARCMSHDIAGRPTAAEVVAVLQSSQASFREASAMHSPAANAVIGSSPPPPLPPPPGPAKLVSGAGARRGPQGERMVRSVRLQRCDLPSPMLLVLAAMPEGDPLGVPASVLAGGSCGSDARAAASGGGDARADGSSAGSSAGAELDAAAAGQPRGLEAAGGSDTPSPPQTPKPAASQPGVLLDLGTTAPPLATEQ